MQNLYCNTQRMCVYVCLRNLTPSWSSVRLRLSVSVLYFLAVWQRYEHRSICELVMYGHLLFIDHAPYGYSVHVHMPPRTRVLLIFYGFIIVRFSEWCPLYLHACIELYIIYHTNQCLTVSSSSTSFSPRRQSQSAWCLLFLGRNR